ncbi:MAG: hypothetical protein RR957_06155, partial [Oscillospiraceae bacterium]
ELVKIFVRSQELNVIPSIYVFAEANTPVDSIFGIFRTDFRARPVAASISNYFGITGGSEYLYKYNVDNDSNVFCYFKNGAPILIAWNPNNATELNFDENVTVTDIYGNKLEK